MTHSAAASIHWVLAVDESNFSRDKAENALVAGLLIPKPYRPQDLTDALKQAVPQLCWPLHAAYLNLPVTFAVARIAAGKPEPTQSLLTQHCPSELDRGVQAVAAGEMPKYDDLRAMQEALKRCKDSTACKSRYRLHQEMLDAGRAIRRVMQILNGAQVFVAAEAYPRSASTTQPSRYESLLTALLERLGQVLKDQGTNHEVFPEILGLCIRRNVYLQRRHVQSILKHLGLNQQTAPKGNHVLVHIGRVCSFDNKAPGHLVLAGVRPETGKSLV